MGWLLAQTATGQSKTTTGNGLKGEYFDGTSYQRKVFTRIDPQIDFDWEWRSTPGPGIGHSFYSVRWTGKLYAPTTGVYKFTATVDDGIRLWVGGKKVMDVWSLNDSKTFQGEISLKAGQYYDFRVDYFNDVHGGSIRLFWMPPKQTAYTVVTTNFLFRPNYQPPKPVLAKAVEKPVAVKPKPQPVVVRSSVMPNPVANKTPVVAASIPAPVIVPERFEALKTGDKLVLKEVFFEQSQYRLLPESYAELNRLVRAMTGNPALQIAIGGHTDNVGDPRLNLALSENRAKVIATYLIRNGIDSQRIETRGYGGTQPVAENTTEAGRSKNRRVEFVVK
ncbi:OmpA family protein [Larkinella arboricola]|nr:PA14 domain-containing protein [Larkinella arboricola]